MNCSCSTSSPTALVRQDAVGWTLTFEYHQNSDKIKKVFTNGQCGCGGGSGAGTYTLTYADSTTYAADVADTTYDTDWGTRTVVQQPDGKYFTQYFDETGQPLSRVLTNSVPTSYTDLWATHVVRNSAGQMTAIHSPAQIGTGYTHDSGGNPAGTFTTSGSTGLVTVFGRVSGTDMAGFPESVQHKDGTGSASYDSWTQYTSRALAVSTATVVRPFIEKRRAYHTETATVGDSSKYDETIVLDTSGGASEWWSSTSSNVQYIVPKKLVTSYPVVTTGKNGSNSATTTTRYLRSDGTTAFTVNQEGIFTYTKHTNGQVVMTVEDVKTNDATDIDVANDDPSGVFGITEAGDSTYFHRKTTFTYDAQGRSDITTMPDGHKSKAYYSKIGDGRMATISLPAFSSSSTVWYGPAGYTVSNHAGRPEVSCTLAVAAGGINTATGGKALTDWITEATTDPLDALHADFKGTSRANIQRLTRTFYNEPGSRVEETWAYHEVHASTWGSSGTNYDVTSMTYDDMGRVIRTVDPTGTINRTAYDTPGRAYQRFLGTDDTGDDGSPMAGTNNMVKVSETEFDAGDDHGNSYVTKQTAFVEGSTTDRRDTSFLNDYRGRAVVVVGAQAPYTLSKFDNLGRTVAVAQYSSSSGLDAGDDPVSLDTNRVAVGETTYDERGQVYLTTRYKVDQSSGADTDSITSSTWYDPVGRAIKVQGEQVSKTDYDRLGRATHQFVIGILRASGGGDETAYADADDVADDVVLEEHQTVHENSTNNVLFSFSIQRHATESSVTYGALDTNADNDRTTITAANIKGRIQIAASWYDALDRLSSSVAYGTNNIVGNGSTSTGTFTRAGSAPSRPNTTDMQTDYIYDDAGNLKDVMDALGRTARTEFDDAGRKTATIANYVNGTPSSATGDDDIYTRYTYSAGLQTEMWVDIDGDNAVDAADQVTKYFYGVTTGTGSKYSKVNSNRLLHAVKYPDSANAGTTTTYFYTTSDADVMTYAYNAQGQQVYQKDQPGNIISQTYDTGGRLTKRTVDTVVGDFDASVRRVEIAYLSRGLTNTVTQYNATTSGTALDQVQYSYNDWGNLTKFEQDVDGVIGAGGRAAFNVQYSFSKSVPTKGRQTLRRSTMTMPNGLSLAYAYGSGDINDLSSRAFELSLNSVKIVEYQFMGAGSVVGTDLPEPDAFSHQYTSTLADYPDLDRFNRITSSRWTKDLSTDRDFYDVDIAYDLNSNITAVQDNIQRSAAGSSATRSYDVLYGLDGLNRVASTDEGELNGGKTAISTKSRSELWGLDQLGNFDTNQMSLNGDGDFVDANEIDDDRTHNLVNEVTAWKPAGVSKSPDYDDAGNLIDDKYQYKFYYDPFGRMTAVKDQTNASVAEYRYNGLGYRIGWHYDVDADKTLESTSDDPWFYFCYDERWRMVGTYRSTDSDPKEQFVYHAAGLNGMGGSSYIDSVILRDKDASKGWAASADALDERRYFCQNWRADVSAVLTDTGKMVESVKYSAYGTPIGIPAGDTDSDGDYDGTDDNAIKTWAVAYDVRADADLDGTVNTSTDSTYAAGFTDDTMGRGKLSRSDCSNRKGYAGYEGDSVLGATSTSGTGRFWHVRHRVLDSTLGRWTRRDPAGYVDSANLFGYAATQPVSHLDTTGLFAMAQPWLPGWAPPSYTDPLVPVREPGPGPWLPPPPCWQTTSGIGDCFDCCIAHEPLNSRCTLHCIHRFLCRPLQADIPAVPVPIDLAGCAGAPTTAECTECCDSAKSRWDTYWQAVFSYERCMCGSDNNECAARARARLTQHLADVNNAHGNCTRRCRLIDQPVVAIPPHHHPVSVSLEPCLSTTVCK